MNFKAVLALPKTARSAQTYKSISFIWMFRVLGVYNFERRIVCQRCRFLKIFFLLFLAFTSGLGLSKVLLKKNLKLENILNFIFYSRFTQSGLGDMLELNPQLPWLAVIEIQTILLSGTFQDPEQLLMNLAFGPGSLQLTELIMKFCILLPVMVSFISYNKNILYNYA